MLDVGRVDYEAMSYERLHKLLVRLLDETQEKHVNLSLTRAVLLLPALDAMRRKVANPGKRSDITGEVGGWQDECHLLGLTAEQVRKWRQLSASEDMILEMLGEEKARKKPKPKSKNTLLAMLAVKMAKAYEAHRTKEVESVVAEILEIDSLESAV